METRSEPAHTVWPFPFTPQDWELTPPAVQAYLRTVHDALGQLQERVDTLQARLTQNSTTSSRPPSSDSPYKKRRCFRAVEAMSDGPSKLIAIDEQPDHQVVHALCLGKTDRPADQPLDPRAQGDMLALDFLG